MDYNDQAVFEWARACVNEAMEEKRNGNMTPLNKLGQNPAFAYYINNVFTTRMMTEQHMAYWNSGMVRELARLKAESEQLEETKTYGDRLNTLESGIDKLMGMMEALLAVQTPKQRQAVVEATQEEESAAENSENQDAQEEPDEAAANPDAEGEPEPNADAEPEPETEAETEEK